MTVDTQLFYLLNNVAGQSRFLDGVIIFLASYLAYVSVAVFIAFVYFSHYEKRKKLEIFVVATLSSIVARYGVTELIRFFYHHPRPFLVLPVHQLLTENSWSFPSGHATFFFAMATAIYLYNKRWGAVFFIMAILITVSRVIAGIHYPSDIIGGALIGALVAYAAFHFTQRSTMKTIHGG